MVYKTVSYIGFVIMLAGLGVAIYGFSFLLKMNDLDKNGIRVTGTVVDINEKAIYRSPWVTFNTLEGEEITFLSELEVNQDLFDYQIGQKVEVVYHKNDPQNCKIDRFWEKHMPQL